MSDISEDLTLIKAICCITLTLKSLGIVDRHDEETLFYAIYHACKDEGYE